MDLCLRINPNPTPAVEYRTTSSNVFPSGHQVHHGAGEMAVWRCWKGRERLLDIFCETLHFGYWWLEHGLNKQNARGHDIQYRSLLCGDCGNCRWRDGVGSVYAAVWNIA